MFSMFVESCVPVCVCVCCVDTVDYCHVASFTLEVSSIHSKSRASRAHTHTHTQGSSHTVAHRHTHKHTHTHHFRRWHCLGLFTQPGFAFVPACPKCILESHFCFSQLGVHPNFLPALLRFLLCHSKPALLTPDARHRSNVT